MKKLIYIATLLTLVGTQGRLLADEQIIGESAPVSGEQEKSVAPAQEPTQAPATSVQQEPVRQEDVVAEMPEEPKAEPLPAEHPAEQPEAPPAEPAIK
jgi:hypothetical protein